MDICKVSKSGMVKTSLRNGDVIGFDAASESVKIFRPLKKRIAILCFKEKTRNIFGTFYGSWTKEQLEKLVRIMAASAGHNKVVPIPYGSCIHLKITWGYQICK